MKIAAPFLTQKKPLWVDILLVVAGIVGVIVFIVFNQQALPDAALDLKYSRPQITQLAQNDLESLGFSVPEYQFVLAFNEDRMASFFLQQTIGVEQSNQKIQTEALPIYSWRARWFKPLQKEEFSLSLSTTGSLVKFEHIIPEDAPGTNIPKTEAQTLAERFLDANTNWQACPWEQVDSSSVTQPGGRIDHTFSWKATDYAVGASELRYTVTIQGDRLGYMNYWIKPPETYTRNFTSQRTRAGFFNDIAYVIGFVGFLLICTLAMSLGKPDFRQALFPALLGGGVRLASYLNYIPLFPNSYTTTQDYALFWSEIVIQAFSSSFVTFLMVFVAWMGAQTLSKLVWPRQDRILERGPERWLKFSLSAWRGLLISGVHLGYVVTFYLLTSRFLGWWSPIGQGSASNIYATPLPFIEALDVGVNAALIEELLFRLAGISFVFWLSRKRWLALLVPGLLWAFAHLSYVSDPIYARGVELTFVALLDGIIFLQFGLLTTIVAHCSYNMIVSSVGLFQSSDPYYQFSGLVVLAILFSPLLPGLIAWLKQKMGKTTPILTDFELAPATAADIPQLSALPVKADWEALLADNQRTILCLHSGGTLLGFSTGYLQAGNTCAIVDGVYVIPAWRRNYWGSTLLDKLQEQFKVQGVEHFYSYAASTEKKSFTLLKNLFWRTDTIILKQAPAPSISLSVIEPALSWLRQRRIPVEQPVMELEIPRSRDF
jgi:hypothetical protein